MTRTFELEIIAPAGVIYDDTAEALVAIGTAGSFGILPHHAPMLAAIKKGVLKVKKNPQRTLLFQCGSGILKVKKDNKVIVLADQCSSSARVPES